MSDHDDNSSTARLAAQRLARPGVLDRTPVARRYERLHQGMHELTERLHQRATASGESGGRSFVWRRSPAPSDTGAEGLTVPTTSGPAAAASIPAASSTPVSTTTLPVAQRATVPEAESVSLAARLASRAQAPGVLAVGSTISRPAAPGSYSHAPAFAAHLQSRYGVSASGVAAATAPMPAPSGLSISRATAGVVRRQVDTATPTETPSSHDRAGVVPPLSRVSPGITAAPMLARNAPAASAMAGTLPLAGHGALAATDSRTANAPRVPGLPMMPAAGPLLPAGSAAGAPLVLRRMLAAPVQSSTPLPTVIPPAVVQLPREETPSPLRPKPEPVVATRVGAHTGSDLDRIAEEVGRRLMRRLEIERERKGIRQWR